MQPVTIRDVADRAGVSVKTVSNVIHDVRGRVSPQTAERVRRTIAELGYRPNLSARRLRNGRTQVIALALSDLRNPYFSELAAAVIRAASERGYTVLIDEFGGNAEAELKVAEGLSDPLIDGVILSPLFLDRAKLAQKGFGVPLVVLGEPLGELPCDHVGFDNLEASRRVVEHLLEQGATRIGVIGHQQSRPPRGIANRRLDGYRSALRRAGIRFDRGLAPALAGRMYSRQVGARAMEVLLSLQRPPDGVYCFADVLAFGALRAAHDAKVSIPDDLKLVGFDGVEESCFVVPSLTTIAADIDEMAYLAVAAIIDRITAKQTIPPRAISCSYSLRVGESTVARATRRTTPAAA